MTAPEPEPPIRLSRESSPTVARRPLSRGARIADVIVTVVLWLVQVAGVGVTLMSVIAIPMSTDNCAYVTCGDEKWIHYALWTVLASMAPAAMSSFVGLIMLIRNRISFWWPFVGGLTQWGLICTAWYLATRAGPLPGA